MIIGMETSSGGGGGNAKSGTAPDVTAASQNVQIDTGLSSVKKFSLFAKMTNYTYPAIQLLHYDDDVNAGKYDAVMVTNTAYAVGNSGTNVGTAVNTYTFKLDSIVGGTVNLVAASGGDIYAKCTDIQWFAE